MTKKWVILTLVATTALIAWYKWQPKTVEAIQVTQGNISQTIVATGRVSPVSKIDLASLMTAKVERIHAREGEVIAAGQTLMTLSDASIDASVLQAQANLSEAEQRLKELSELTRPLAQHSLNQAKTTLTLAQTEYQRYANLQSQNLVSQSSMDIAKKTLDISQANYETAYKQWQASQENGTNTQLILSRLNQAKAALILAQAKQSQLIISSPNSGILMQRLVEEGATVQAGKTLISIARDGETRIEAPIDEKSLRFLALNQSARIIADAYPQHPFDATLALIYPTIDPNRATINVRFIVNQPPAFLRPDMTVSLELITAHAPNALIVPSQSIRDLNTSSPWVVKIEQGKTVKQPITLGIKGIGHTQILSGVSLNDWLVTQADIPLNTRVAAKARPSPATP